MHYGKRSYVLGNVVVDDGSHQLTRDEQDNGTLGENEMDINHYYLYRISRERMQKYLQEAEQQRLVKLAYPVEHKTHQTSAILTKIKNFLQGMFFFQGIQRLSSTRKTGSLTKRGST